MQVFRAALALAALIVCAPAAGAHELMDNRATLVMRDRSHLSLTLYVRYTEAMHRALAPQASYGEFLVAVSSLPPPDFEKQMRRGHEALQSGTRVHLEGAKGAALANWTWPDPATTQRLFQQRVMESTVGGGHQHEEPLEIRAEVVAPSGTRGASVEFSKALGRVLLVWYRPRQTWVEAGQRSPTLRFD